jgi:hypothetical protein
MADKQPRVEVYWTTVTYRTVIVGVLLLLGLVFGGWWFLHKASFEKFIATVTKSVAGGANGATTTSSNPTRFVNLDGRVQVRKVGSLNFVPADFQMNLEKGDVIQTSADAVARISFANGTTYTVQPETLITVESSAMGGAENTPTTASVSVKSGEVDLATTTSTAEVSFEDNNSVAQVNRNTRAAVRSDPGSQQHAVTITTGTAELRRGGQVIPIQPFERASFSTGGEVQKSKVMAPPDLVSPLNLEPIITQNPKLHPVRFEWKPVEAAVEYHLRVSATSMFTQLLAERRVQGTSVTLSGFDAGDYFWRVTARDAKRQDGQDSETRKFMLAAAGAGQEMLLEIEETRLHGTVVEILGRTEPGATVIINGQAVPRIGSDGRFQYFTPPMARGAQTIVISGQNRRGGTALLRKTIVIP